METSARLLRAEGARAGRRLNALGWPGRLLHGLYYTLPLVHRRPRVLLLLGHMRCGSTLLAHILASHRQIAGYGEAHLSYRGPRDLLRLRLHVFVRSPAARITQRYVMDKVVNERFDLDPAVLRAPHVRALLLLREPEPAMASLLRVLPDWTEADALAHYRTRTEALATYARVLGGTGRAFALTYGQLLHQTDAVLDALTRFLELDAPLDEHYRPTATTGVWGWGDTTERIRAGRVVRDHEPTSFPLSAAAVAAGRRAYDACAGVLAQHTLGVGPGPSPVTAP